MNTAQRNGPTLVDVVVIVLIVSAIMGLIVPAIRNARNAGRLVQCMNNERNVALSVITYASSNDRRLPAQATYLVRKTAEENQMELIEGRSWAVDMIPYLAAGSLFDTWSFDEPWNSDHTDPAHKRSNTELSAGINFDCFVCPNDPSAFEVKGGLSYVLNCGIGDSSWNTTAGIRDLNEIESGQHYLVEPFDWNGNGVLPPEDEQDAAVSRDSMLFWPEFEFSDDIPGKTEGINTHRIGEIYDGSSNTILLTENINAGTTPGRKVSSWTDPQLSSCGFLLPIDPKQISPSVHSGGGSLATLVVDDGVNPAVNGMKIGGEGIAPFPNSNHSGGIVFAFCDGACQKMNADIDMTVYARLITPCGTRPREIQDFVSEKPVDSDSF